MGQENNARVARLVGRVGEFVLREAHPIDTEADNDTAVSTRWSALQCIAFRWASLYILLYCLPFPAGALPGLDWAEDLWQEPWHVAIVPWVGEHVLRLEQPVTFLNTGSGDTASQSAHDLRGTFVTLSLATQDRDVAIDRTDMRGMQPGRKASALVGPSVR